MSKAIGTWFEGATVSKTPSLAPDARCSLLLFYHYAAPPLNPTSLGALKTFLQTLTTTNELGGRLRVAAEGLNCTISGTHATVRAFSQQLSEWIPTSALPSSTAPFATVDFKFIDDLPPDRAFKDCKILPVNELVFYGVSATDAPLSKGGVHLEPKEYHEKMKEPNTVIIDVRNSYEADIGKFNGQDGAVYIDPKMRKSTDFKAWLDKPETQEQLTGKKVLMYCTGGVRCERASALLKTNMGDKVSKERDRSEGPSRRTAVKESEQCRHPLALTLPSPLGPGSVPAPGRD